ncbi:MULTISPECIES: N-acetylglucosamine-6-phosphate deacetylase [unclassified Corallococcus]|uniref:N-acetylglucosamine-6-phosphate deacetylase n=1 Tax=unclassified Corallococcus TaxID=2685029 RepID=UPI001A8F6D06|nr:MULTISPECIES: N-acetylglucosamine-6-phosphate deacetylase [unclassified Corallococcus]MBN9688061.1 N-acetylglucosamine-6-phosphate deacetylase [Corallococcus sp. NCSPR001]WAS88129.1 N-acetylglucosamine-6-phosphate deacetylase [Corallococcus sp. NCRR]
MPTPTVLKGARVFTGDQLLEGHAVVIEDGTVRAVVPSSAIPTGATVHTLPGDTLLAPGFVDVQVNGAGGVLFNDTPTEAAALAIASAMRTCGTTGLLPTFITDDAARMREACEAALTATARPDSGVLGIHLEGPFISRERAGVHVPSFIRTPDPRDLDYLTALPRRFAAHGGRVLMTLAPECVDDATLRRLANAGVVLSAGHTAATSERTTQALSSGVRGFTHLFNAMPPVMNRQPGPVVAALTHDDAWCGVIADGVHVHADNLRLLLKVKPPGKVFLVTDAMPPVGTPVTSFTLQGRTILRRHGRLETEDGTLAGADIDLTAAVRHCVHSLGVPLEEALRMASRHPATFMGLHGHRGRIAPGHRADLVLLKPDLSVHTTWVGGQTQSNASH